MIKKKKRKGSKEAEFLNHKVGYSEKKTCDDSFNTDHILARQDAALKRGPELDTVR